MANTENKVHRLRTKLAIKAKQEPKFRFYSLYSHVYRMDVLREAWNQVRRNGGGPGIDNISLNSFDSEEKVTKLLISLQEELKSKTYRPMPVKRVMIPKGNGKMRPLGIPTIKDRVTQAAVKLVLEPIFEQDFLECSYGFRPNRSAHQALSHIEKAIKSGKRAVFDADLKGYFDSIPHDKLWGALRMRIVDRSLLNLIKLWLRAPIAENTFNGRGSKLSYPKKGTPQGGIISPLLANIFLHWFDRFFHDPDGPAHWAKAELVRYADDFVVLAKYQGPELQGFIYYTLETRMGLELNREKTTVVHLGKDENLDFLGYTFSLKKDRHGRQHKYLSTEPSKRSVQKARDKVNEILATNMGCIPFRDLVKRTNTFLRGWGKYFSCGYPRAAKRKLNFHVRQRCTRHLRRRSQRPYRPPEGTSFYKELEKLGLMYL